jgi:hypothetical protein
LRDLGAEAIAVVVETTERAVRDGQVQGGGAQSTTRSPTGDRFFTTYAEAVRTS